MVALSLRRKGSCVGPVRGCVTMASGPHGGLRSQTAAEQLVFEEKNKAQRLQTELDVSEQVQRDFVKLSQTLQVRPVGTRGPAPWQLCEGSGCGHRRETLPRRATACTWFLS